MDSEILVTFFIPRYNTTTYGRLRYPEICGTSCCGASVASVAAVHNCCGASVASVAAVHNCCGASVASVAAVHNLNIKER